MVPGEPGPMCRQNLTVCSTFCICQIADQIGRRLNARPASNQRSAMMSELSFVVLFRRSLLPFSRRISPNADFSLDLKPLKFEALQSALAVRPFQAASAEAPPSSPDLKVSKRQPEIFGWFNERGPISCVSPFVLLSSHSIALWRVCVLATCDNFRTNGKFRNLVSR